MGGRGSFETRWGLTTFRNSFRSEGVAIKGGRG